MTVCVSVCVCVHTRLISSVYNGSTVLPFEAIGGGSPAWASGIGSRFPRLLPRTVPAQTLGHLVRIRLRFCGARVRTQRLVRNSPRSPSPHPRQQATAARRDVSCFNAGFVVWHRAGPQREGEQAAAAARAAAVSHESGCKSSGSSGVGVPRATQSCT